MIEPVAARVTVRLEAARGPCASGAWALTAGLVAVLRGLLLWEQVPQSPEHKERLL